MSASDHLSQNQFRLFHGTSAKTIKGGFINPTRQRGSEWDGHGPEQAFASTRLEDAAKYGPNVYEVHAHDDVENHGSGVFGSPEGFKVKRQLKPEVVNRYSRIVGPMRAAKEDLEHRKWLGQTSREQWTTEGGNKYHMKYDTEGNEVKTLLKGRQLRPGDPE
jgi:hypothetical protein